MPKNSNKKKFVTEAFLGALEKNDEMNKGGKVKKGRLTPILVKDKKDAFPTDAFREALKINKEMNKSDTLQEPNVLK